MSLSTQEISRLRRIVGIAEKLIAKGSEGPPRKRGRPPGKAKLDKMPRAKRIRRTGKELARFRKMLKTERNKGVPVADIARRNGISAAYIYMLP